MIVEAFPAGLIAIQAHPVADPRHIGHEVQQHVIAVGIDIGFHQLIAVAHIQLAVVIGYNRVRVKEADLIGGTHGLIILFGLQVCHAAEVLVGEDALISAKVDFRVIASDLLRPRGIEQLGEALGQGGFAAAFRPGDEHLLGEEGACRAKNIVPVAEDIMADLGSGDGVAAAGGVEQHHFAFGEESVKGRLVVPVADEERVDALRDDLAHSGRPRDPAVGVFGDVRFVQHTDDDMIHVLHLLAQPLLAQLVGDGRQSGFPADLFRLRSVI